MIRILCCGNADRGDDAAGVLVAERLRERGVPAEICPGEACALMDAWSGAHDVIVIDAVKTGAAAGTVHVWDASEAKIPSHASPSTHSLGVSQAIELTRALGKLPRRLRVIGIEGASFEVGSTACVQVEEAAESLARRLAELARPSHIL